MLKNFFRTSTGLMSSRRSSKLPVPPIPKFLTLEDGSLEEKIQNEFLRITWVKRLADKSNLTSVLSLFDTMESLVVSRKEVST